MFDIISPAIHDPSPRLRQSVLALLRALPQQLYTKRPVLEGDIHPLLLRRAGHFPPGYTARDLIAWAIKEGYIQETDGAWRISITSDP